MMIVWAAIPDDDDDDDDGGGGGGGGGVVGNHVEFRYGNSVSTLFCMFSVCLIYDCWNAVHILPLLSNSS